MKTGSKQLMRMFALLVMLNLTVNTNAYSQVTDCETKLREAKQNAVASELKSLEKDTIINAQKILIQVQNEEISKSDSVYIECLGENKRISEALITQEKKTKRNRRLAIFGGVAVVAEGLLIYFIAK